MSEKIKNRPPIVVILGHVDHGKSSILEAIKDLKITQKESGGITQHIGAYEVEEHGKKITFIDTPGHEAFCAMRSRGVCVADIAVLVIAADEGIKNQTKEVIKSLKESNIPFIVAINKIDKAEANVEKVKRELAEKEIYLETMGGEIPFVKVSATTKEGIEHLLEVIILVAEMEELKEEINCPAQGIIVESYLNPHKGPIATLIVQKGILKKGDFLATESSSGKVKNLETFQGKNIDQAIPSMPAVILGFEKVPQAGEFFQSSQELKKIQIEKSNNNEINTDSSEKVLFLIIKTDVIGSVEAINHMIDQIPQEKIKIQILKSEPGWVTESDIKMAARTGAKILCFGSKINKTAQDVAQREKIKVLQFNIIYELIQAVENFLRKMIEPEIVKTVTGKIKILEVFKNEKSRQIIGGKAIYGFIKRGSKLEIFRNEESVGSGKINSLQQNKKETDLINKGSECGILYEGDVIVEEGDILEAYIEEKIKKEL